MGSNLIKNNKQKQLSTAMQNIRIEQFQFDWDAYYSHAPQLTRLAFVLNLIEQLSASIKLASCFSMSFFYSSFR